MPGREMKPAYEACTQHIDSSPLSQFSSFKHSWMTFCPWFWVWLERSTGLSWASISKKGECECLEGIGQHFRAFFAWSSILGSTLRVTGELRFIEILIKFIEILRFIETVQSLKHFVLLVTCTSLIPGCSPLSPTKNNLSAEPGVNLVCVWGGGANPKKIKNGMPKPLQN